MSLEICSRVLIDILLSSCQVFEDTPTLEHTLPLDVYLTLEISIEENGTIELGPWKVSSDDTILSINNKIMVINH